MIAHTNAYASYRDLSQAHLDFVVLVCHAVPALRSDLLLPAITVFATPDYFKKNTKGELTTYASVYQDELARVALISVFSYFENYVKETLREIVEFHGGAASFVAIAKARTTHVMAPLPAAEAKSKNKLREYAKKGKDQKYKKHSSLLEIAGYRFPTELFAHYGATTLLAKTDEKRGMRAWEIPDVIESCLSAALTKTERNTIDNVRVLRNKIGHGKAPAITLKSTMKAASELRSIAAKVDAHVVNHFFVLQRFV